MLEDELNVGVWRYTDSVQQTCSGRCCTSWRTKETDEQASSEFYMNAIDRRATPRFRVQFRTILSRAGYEEEIGILHDLSLNGCQLKTSARLQRGFPLELRIHVPDLEWPLMIAKAEVQWVKGQIVGLAFHNVTDTEQQRLEKIVESIRKDSGMEDTHIAVNVC